MELGTYVDELQRQLAAAAAAGSEETRETAGRLTTALDAAARLVLLEALGAAAAEISVELAPGSVDVRLRGRDPEFVVTPAQRWDEPAAPSAPTPPPVVESDEGATTRTTLRLPDELKSRVEAAAARAGVSVNTWLVRAIGATLDGGANRPATQELSGTRVTGWVR